MKKNNHDIKPSNRILLILSLLLLIQSSELAARGSVQNFYIQVGAGLGLDSFSSNDINDEALSTSGAIETLGAQLTGRAHVGISNIMEIEIQRRLAGSSHSIKSQVSSDLDVPLELNFDFLLFKLNPLPGDYNIESEPFYLVYGTGDIDYLTDKDEGWQGNADVVGMEWALMSYRRTYRLGFKVISATLDRRGPLATNKKYKAKMLLFDISVAIGF